MTLKTQMASDVTDVFLNTDEHAEAFTVIEKDGTQRTSIVGCVVAERVKRDVIKRRELSTPVLHVLFANDATTGIVDPQRGLTFTRDADTRIPKVPLAYQQTLSRHASGLIVELFESPRTVRAGFQEANQT